mgnify:CR=1 FL=1
MDYFLTNLKREVAEEVGITQNDVENTLRVAFDKIGDQLVQGNKVYLIDFFNLEPKDYKAKQVKNPQTGEPMVIEPYRTVLCKPTKAMKRKLKNAVLD